MHTSSAEQLRRFVDAHLVHGEPTNIADVGSFDESCTYRRILTDTAWKYTGIDLHGGANVDLVVVKPYDWTEIPWNSMDVVVSGQTLEHVDKPWRWIRSIERIVRSGGLVWICAPNTWEFHEVPRDCWRIWPDGMRALFDEAGLVTLEAYKEGQDTVGVARKN